MKPAPATIQIDEIGPQKFTLAVTFDGQRFDCGNYISRAAAMQAGRLFVQRKEGEAVGQRARTRRKPEKAERCRVHPVERRRRSKSSWAAESSSRHSSCFFVMSKERTQGHREFT
jgi:hypothetical protein